MVANGERINLHDVMLVLLFGLGVTALLTTVVAGSILTLFLLLIYELLFQPATLPAAEILVPVICSAGVCLLILLVRHERDAPDHTIRSVGASRARREEHSELIDTVQLVAHQAVVPVPDVYVAPMDAPVSFTTGFKPQTARLVVSEGLVTLLEQSELEAVIAHEIAHVKNRDAAVMTAVSLPVGSSQRVFRLLSNSTIGVEHGQTSRADLEDALVTAGLILVFPVWIVAVLCWAALSRTREFTADSAAIAITGNPVALATALEKIDSTLAERPSTDLRSAEISPLAIVEPPRKQPDFGGVPLPTSRLNRVAKTHPRTERRLERLRESDP
ncbi:M48 family metallopeptidase [Natrinema salaciae]|uniref:Heat shock protein HtpX n=1 Tax=Natrinema salaciae TaxID=1186196 RepID=A0A1H9JFK1_9EURY|nr:M48 family metalloprotease [Natrinema salaciae]SEQ85527.1 heat shock protein HtpX [Natrinema salaciae]